MSLLKYNQITVTVWSTQQAEMGISRSLLTFQ